MNQYIANSAITIMMIALFLIKPLDSHNNNIAMCISVQKQVLDDSTDFGVQPPQLQTQLIIMVSSVKGKSAGQSHLNDSRQTVESPIYQIVAAPESPQC